MFKYFSCPKEYNKVIPGKKQCIDNCSKDDTYKYQFRSECYKECPKGTKTSSKINNFCELICSKEYPFELVENQTCTNFCSINDFHKKRCISNYQDKETNADLILNIILNELSSNSFNISIFDKNENITINENNVSFALINLKNKNIVNINSDLSLCINELKKYYDIYEDKNVIVLKIEVENKVKYEVFSQLKGIKLERLDLNKCSNYYNFYNIKCDLYSINSIINDLCISCQKDYYEMYNDTTNINPYINCYNFLEGYYLYNNKYFKRCFYSCLSCEKEGDNEKHSCGSCKESYPFEITSNSD